MVTDCDDYHYKPQPDYRRYGFEIRLDDHVYEGAPINFTALVGESGLHMENYYLPAEACRSGLLAAGFTDVMEHQPVVPREAITAHEPGFWDELIDHPVFALIDCVKT